MSTLALYEMSKASLPNRSDFRFSHPSPKPVRDQATSITIKAVASLSRRHPRAQA